MDQQRQPPASPSGAPRAGTRSFSFRSDKSGNSSGRQQNIDDLTDSPREKERRDSIWKADSKANPNAALREAQPGEINLLEKTTIEPLRSFQHRDTRGNVITDPDLSNPTRPRMERPLDTIRSFEKAIDSGYKRRTMMRGESYNEQNASRRNSYIGPHDNGRQSQMGGGGGYYNSPRRGEDFQQHGHGQQRMRYGQRMQSDSAIMRGNSGMYPQHGYHPSHDTVGTNGSDSTGPWGNSTGPSSENSSVDRVQGAAHMKGYGQDGGHDAIDENGAYQQNGYGRPEQRRPIALGNSGPPPPPQKGLPTVPRPEPEKRKSWLQRRFSKKG
ncbi:hypothetical protein AMS68_001400 [Peltaster fructicola]|uniref:DUF2406 domain-containing protein n=1 Tax=Peltaster fructicola TaxID=286661 RepID=A0A6H0XMD9_9PEZI|nr:hypothetical protein AMS68_001400 [Peltaster fructicola]